MHRFSRQLILVFFLVGALTFLPAGPALAVPTLRYVDTTGSDASNDCSSILTPCLTVGHAITQSAAGDTIKIAQGTYTENISITIDLTLIGAAMDGTILDGGGVARVVTVAAATNVSISALTIQNGSTGSSGGGIANDGTLSLELVRISDNTAYSGGGISAAGPLTVTDSVISGNDATSAAGGGIHSDGAHTVSLTSVTMNGNTSPTYSGAIHVQSGGTLNLTNSTLTGNSGTSSGALTIVSGSSATVLNSTIANNTASGGNAAVANYGTISFKNTIVSMNDEANCFSDGAATWTSLGNNLDSGATCSFGAGGDQSGTNPLLALLGDYGGPVPTRTLLGGSPAIDAGTNTGCPGTDARGFPRPIDGNNDTTATCDIGADEMKEQTTTTLITGETPDPSAVGASVLVSASVTGSLTTPTGSVEISGSDSNCTITLSSGSGSCSVSFSSSGPRLLVATYTGDGTHDASDYSADHLVYASQIFISQGANDGWVLESTEASGVGGSLESVATTFRVGDDAADKQYRGLLSFNTSSLPDTAVITRVTLKVRKQGLAGTDPFATHGTLIAAIRKPYFGSAVTLANGDFQAAQSKQVGFSSTPVASWYSTNNNSAIWPYVNKTGTTQFRLRFTLDDNDDLGADYVRFYSSNAGAAYRPQLIIEYYVP